MLLLKNWNRITVIAAKGRRYQGRVDSYRPNRQFENNQKQFYSELDQEEERCYDDQPVAEQSKQFWGNMWSQSADQSMQSGYKTIEVKLMLKNRTRQLLPQEVWRRYLVGIRSHKLEVTRSRLTPGVLVKEF